MNINRLKYFSVVAGTKSIRKASEIIGISPGSLSKAMTTLEGELGEKLTLPKGRGIEVSEFGRLILARSQRLLEEHQAFMESIERFPLDDLAKLRCATFEVFSTYFFAEFIATKFSSEKINLLELTPGDIEQAVIERSADFGITYLPVPDHLLEYIEIGSLAFGIFGAAKWSNTEFTRLPFAVPASSMSTSQHDLNSLDLWPQCLEKRFVKYEFDMLESALQTTSLGQSVIHCPTFIAALHNKRVIPSYRLTRIPYPESARTPHKSIYLVYRNDKRNSMLAIERKLAVFFRQISKLSL